jgi:hypothetical protein
MIEGLSFVLLRVLSPEIILQTLSFLTIEPLAQGNVIYQPGVIVA